MGKVIGRGTYGTVRIASPYSNLDKVFAIKSIPRDRVEGEIEMLE